MLANTTARNNTGKAFRLPPYLFPLALRPMAFDRSKSSNVNCLGQSFNETRWPWRSKEFVLSQGHIMGSKGDQLARAMRCQLVSGVPSRHFSPRISLRGIAASACIFDVT